MYLQILHPDIEHSAIDPKNNLNIDDVAHAVESNNAIDYSERLRSTLNDAVRNGQTLSLEEKLLEFNSRFNVASDAVRARMLQEVDHGMHMLTREEQNIARIQDPPEMRGRRGRTFGKGGSRRCTAAEIVEKELKRSDRGAPRPQQQSTESEALIIDLTSSSAASQQRPGPSILTTAPQQSSGPFTAHIASQRPGTPFIMTFSASGTVIRSPQRTEGPTSSTLSSSMPQDPDIMVLESWTAEEVQALPNIPNACSNAPSNQPTPALSSQTQYPSSNLTSRSQCQHKRPAHYQVKLVQSFKCVWKENRE